MAERRHEEYYRLGGHQIENLHKELVLLQINSRVRLQKHLCYQDDARQLQLADDLTEHALLGKSGHCD